jgi:RHS repeat-associated protein
VSYNVLDMPVLTTSHGPARVHAMGPDAWKPRDTPAEEISVTTYYDDMGRTLGVTTTASPIAATTEHEFEYDRAGRKTSERTGHVTQRYTYDKAGNVVTWTTPRNFQIHSSFDVMGRPLRRSRPEVAHGAQCLYPLPDHPMLCTNAPLLPNNSTGGYTIASDTTFYRYDLLGRMVFARSNDAIVERSYLPNGAIRTDTTRMRQYSGTQSTSHVYGIEYGYDRLNRLSWVRHPTNLATNAAAQVDSFTYDAVTGALSTARDRGGVAFSFHQDLLGRPTSTHMPGVGSAALIDSTVYDIGSRAVRRMTGTASAPAGMMDERMQYDARGKTIRVDLPNGTASASMNWYSGLGNLVGTEWDNVAGNGNTREEYVIDALGNIRERRTPLQSGTQHPHDFYYEYAIDGVNQRVLRIVKKDTASWVDSLDFQADSARRLYDGSGNVTTALQAVELGTGSGTRTVATRNYYSADDRLYAVHHFDQTPSVQNGSWEEYRYDPLGRRIIVRTVREGLCSGGGIGDPGPVCQSTITRFVWSGDQILWELRAPGAAGDNLEATNGSAVPNHAIRFGRVSYLHAGGIDRPLTITKDETSSIIPHQNWRGTFAWGTWGKGTYKGYQSDCVSGGPSTCANVAWPGWQTNAWHAGGNPGEQEYWMGSLADGMRNVNGQIYMRNRYYDPATGQFTQVDPIGLAGGLNAYGFAAGDPVTYGDPYGLRVVFQDDAEGRRLHRLWDNTKDAARQAMESDDEQIAAAGRVLFNSMQEIEDSRTYTLRVGTHSESSENPWGRTRTEPRGSGLANSSQLTFSTHPSRDFFGLSERMQTVALAHEVGHAWTAMTFTHSLELHERYTDSNANNLENLTRRITGCGGYRPSHNVGGSRC